MAIKFGYWSPILSGGYVLSNIPQRTEWSIASNIRLAQTAESVGFDYTLLPARFMSLECGDGQNDALVSSAYLAAATQRLKIIGAFHTAYWHPAMIAKSAATVDVVSGGRYALNILSGWLKEEYRQFHLPWLEHDERYRQSEEFIQVLRGLWTAEQPFHFAGDYYRIQGATFLQKPVSQPGLEIFQGGNSKAARRMAGKYSDWYFLNGNSVEGAKKQIDEVKAIAREHGREGQVKFGLNAFVILRETEEEALAQKQAIIDQADPELVAGFAQQAKHAGQSTREREGMWENSEFADLVQPNDGFKTRLFGPPELIAERIREYQAIGVDLILTAYLHFNDELEDFGRRVIPLLRQAEGRTQVAVPERSSFTPPPAPAGGFSCGYETVVAEKEARKATVLNGVR
ncbi:MAG: dimethyl sulfone monooxygenase SfnG [Chthoniobacteraceae bacterium]